MKVVAVIQARASSTRLPGKVLMPLLGQPMLARQLERVRLCRAIDEIVVATSARDDDTPVAMVAADAGFAVYRGSLDDVLDRYYQAAMEHGAECVVRLTGDCPVIDPAVVDTVVSHHLEHGFDYTTNAIERTYPQGMDTEVFSFPVLALAWREAMLPSEREHVTPFIHRRPERFNLGHVHYGRDCSHLRLTVDEPADFALIERIYETLYPSNPRFSLEDMLALFDADPELADLNRAVDREAGLRKSLAQDEAFRQGSRNRQWS